MTTSSLATHQIDHGVIPRHLEQNNQTTIERHNPGRPDKTGETHVVRSPAATHSRTPRPRRQAGELYAPTPASMSSVEQLVSFRGAAQRLDLSIRAVYRLVARGHLPHPVKVGGARKFFESDLARYLDALKAHRN